MEETSVSSPLFRVSKPNFPFISLSLLLYPLHSWNKLIETHLVREVIFSLSLSSSGFRSMEFNENVFPFSKFSFSAHCLVEYRFRLEFRLEHSRP